MIMIKKRSLILLSLLLAFQLAARSKGHLVIIGGGDIPDSIRQKIIEFAGKERAEILVIPYASDDPRDSGTYNVDIFKKLGCGKIDWLVLDPNTVNSDEVVAKLKTTTGIYFSGGDQSRLTKLMLNTKVLARIREIYENGGVIGGTSAGAAIMSKVMITGNELINKDPDNPFKTIQAGNVEVVEGFGFIDRVIIDQHFVVRRRQNRLISLILANSGQLGIGIDEATAIVVNPDDTFIVLGEGSVLVYDASHAKNIKQDQKGYFGVEKMITHILIAGDMFNIKKRVLLKGK
jgi:cyanophycinase